MRIAQIAPLFESVPPRFYGGTERIVSFLTEELIRRGHEVTLFASGDSKTAARHISTCQKALRLHGEFSDPHPYHLLELTLAFSEISKYDIIHSHVDYWGFPFIQQSHIPALTTLHGRLDLPELRSLFEFYRKIPFVSISNSQRLSLPELNWVGTVYHGLLPSLYRFSDRAGDYLAYLGRISPEKGPDRAIEVAIRAQVPLKIAAKVDAADLAYFQEVIQPMLDHPLIDFLGEITDQEKNEFLGGAMALLSPVDWPEPFGLTMIESLACGTPVITRPCGSIPEIIEDGLTGFICDGTDELVKAVHDLCGLSRQRCRREMETRFSVEMMVDAYESVYQKLMKLPSACLSEA